MSIGYPSGDCLARYPVSYDMAQPIVERVAREMDNMNHQYPLQSDYDRMLDRVDEEMQRAYPAFMGEDELGPDDGQGGGFYNPDGYRVGAENIEASQRGRRYPGYYPGNYRRGNLARDFLAILLLAELLRRRRIF